jgi:CsoR family transcriptional regulator, copper-sensing transcriptional repressor
MRVSFGSFWKSTEERVGDLQDGTKSEVLRRLKSVEGHVRGVAKMVEGGDVTYAEVVQQTNAIFSAIRRINAVLLKDFVEERAEEEGASEEMVKDLVKAIDRVVK